MDRVMQRYNPHFALLAQLAEQLTLNQRVASSNLAQGISARWTWVHAPRPADPPTGDHAQPDPGRFALRMKLP